MRKFFIIILPIELQEEANAYCAQFADGGEYTFQTLLSETGKKPFTHAASGWAMNKAEEYLIKEKYGEYVYSEQNIETLLNTLNLQFNLTIKKEAD